MQKKKQRLIIDFPEGFRILDVFEIGLYLKDGMTKGTLKSGNVWRLEDEKEE